MKAGLIGLGHLGRAMATRLTAEGVDLTVWNRTLTKAEGLNVQLASSPAALVSEVEVLFLNLFDSAAVLEETFRSAYRHLAGLVAAGAPLFVGGKSLGGRIAAELVSRRPEGDGLAAAGLVELGYPLHAPGRTDRVNLKPLRHIDVPSLFCIGSRDAFCDLDLLRPVLPTLLAPAELYVVEGGDHSLLLPRSSGREPDGAYADVAAKVAAFLTDRGARPRR